MKISKMKKLSISIHINSSIFLFIHVCSPAELLQNGRSTLALIQKETSSGLCCCLCPSNRSPWSRTRFFSFSSLRGERQGDRNAGWKGTTEIRKIGPHMFTKNRSNVFKCDQIILHPDHPRRVNHNIYKMVGLAVARSLQSQSECLQNGWS